MEEHRKQFKIFENQQNLVYLDSAATTQKPNQVIDAMINYYENSNANVHRGLYPLSDTATELYELSRQKIAKFINADAKSIIFTSGTTDSINSIAESLRKSGKLNTGDKVAVSELEHHSNLVPWQQNEIVYLPVDKYEISFQKSLDLIANQKPKVIALSHVSNVTGALLDAAKFIGLIRQLAPGAIVVLDAAQSVSHLEIDVQALDVDILAFSGHKLYGPMGIGVLFAKKELLEELEPFRTGGGMISTVERNSSDWADLPYKFEAGTPNVAGAIGLAAAVDFIKEVGFKNIQSHEEILLKYTLKKLREMPELTVLHPESIGQSAVSFSVDKVHPHDIAQVLGNPEFGEKEKEVAVRAGHHCTQILHRHVFNLSASVRVSIGIYNIVDDIDILLDKLKESIKLFRS